MRKILRFLRKNIRKGFKRYYTWKVSRTVKKYINPLNVNYKTELTSNTYLGKNCNFNGMEISGNGKIMIGDNFHSGTECLVISQIHNYDSGEAIPYDTTYITKDVTIGDNVWLGSKVTILGGITIGEGAIIQAGAVVVSSIPKYAIAGGSPAKVFKYRDIEHYNELKLQGKFH